MGKDLIHTMVSLVLWANDHISEHLDIPPDKKELLEADPKAFVRFTLENLEAWEKKYL